MTRWSIRPADTDDATALSGLMCRAIAQTNSADYPPDVIALLLARFRPLDIAAMIDRRDVFCADENGTLVGTVALEGEQLRGLFVEPTRQGAGLGKFLLAHVEAHAIACGRDTLWLQSSITARDFYARRGYVAERFIEQDDGSVIIMRKRLR